MDPDEAETLAAGPLQAEEKPLTGKRKAHFEGWISSRRCGPGDFITDPP